MMGDHITYYLGTGGKQGIKKCIVEWPEGLSHHDIDISDFSEMLKYENDVQTQIEKFFINKPHS